MLYIAQSLCDAWEYSTIEEINFDRVLRGEPEFQVKIKDFKTLKFTAWMLGYASKNCLNDDFVEIFTYGFKNGWFFDNYEDDKFNDLLKDFFVDIVLMSKDLFITLSDFVMENHPNSKVSKECLLRIAHAIGYSNMSLGRILSLKYFN